MAHNIYNNNNMHIIINIITNLAWLGCALLMGMLIAKVSRSLTECVILVILGCAALTAIHLLIGG